MANIRVDLTHTIHDGDEIKFRSPVDCSEITGLIIYYPEYGSQVSKTFQFTDAHGHNVGDVDHLFSSDVVVKVVLDMNNSKAYVQNADTNAYLEGRLKALDDAIYTHPSYTAKSSGLYKVTVDGTGHVSATTAVAKSDITALGIPAQDTVYTHPDSGATAGTYRSVTVNAQGHVTAGSNPTIAVGQGGTGATTAANARTNLGLSTAITGASISGKTITLTKADGTTQTLTTQDTTYTAKSLGAATYDYTGRVTQLYNSNAGNGNADMTLSQAYTNFDGLIILYGGDTSYADVYTHYVSVWELQQRKAKGTTSFALIQDYYYWTLKPSSTTTKLLWHGENCKIYTIWGVK